MEFCCVHAGPYALTLYFPTYGSLAWGRVNLRLDGSGIQNQDSAGFGPEAIIADTHAGFANGIPRKLVRFPSVTPVKSCPVVNNVNESWGEETVDG